MLQRHISREFRIDQAAEKGGVSKGARPHRPQKNPGLLKSMASEPPLSGAEWVPQLSYLQWGFSPEVRLLFRKALFPQPVQPLRQSVCGEVDFSTL
jgi:hypothetical protein